MKRFSIGLMAALAAVALVPIAMAQDQAQSTDSSSALRVVRDKETGELRAPTAAEASAMIAAENAAAKGRKAAGPESVNVVKHTDGMKSAVLPVSYMTTIYAVKDADGNVRTYHSDPALDAKNPTPEEK